MSNGAVTIKVVPWTGKLWSFKQQFPAYVQQSNHFQALQFKLQQGVIDIYHDPDGVAKSVPPAQHLDNDEHSEEEQKSQAFVRSQLLLASDDPVWLSIFRKIPATAHGQVLRNKMLRRRTRTLRPRLSWTTFEHSTNDQYYGPRPS